MCAARAVLGIPAGAEHQRRFSIRIGCADLNTLAGVVRLHVAAQRVGLRPLIGARLELLTGEAFLAYPVDRDAYGRLSSLLTKGKRGLFTTE